jgi:hypothetical protein
MRKGSARTGIHELRASLQGFFNQSPPDAAIGPSDQDCFVFNVHCLSSLFDFRAACQGRLPVPRSSECPASRRDHWDAFPIGPSFHPSKLPNIWTALPTTPSMRRPVSVKAFFHFVFLLFCFLLFSNGFH